MHPRQVTVEVFHPAEGVVGLWTPSDMAEERPFSVWIGDTDVGVLPHALPHMKLLLQNGQEKVSSISGQSTPWATLWCCSIPCFDPYGLAQTGQETCFPLTQDNWWNFNIFLEAKTLPHLSQGNFLP